MYLQIRNFGCNHSFRSNHHEGKHDYEEHLHQFLEVLCVLKGSLEVTVNGHTETAREGDVSVILPFHAHSYHTPDYCKIWVGVFSSDWISDFIPKDSFVTTKNAVFTPTKSLLDYVLDRIPPPHGMLTDETLSTEKFQSTKALFYAILEEYFKTAKRNTTVLHINALSALYTYIYQHYTEPITIKQAASDLGYTSTYLSHCLSAIPNAGFRFLVNSARIEHAKNLLITTDKKIIDIAFDCGFSTASVFYSAFFKFTGMTPLQYRTEKSGGKHGKYVTLLP